MPALNCKRENQKPKLTSRYGHVRVTRRYNPIRNPIHLERRTNLYATIFNEDFYRDLGVDFSLHELFGVNIEETQ